MPFGVAGIIMLFFIVTAHNLNARHSAFLLLNIVCINVQNNKTQTRRIYA